ncbi:hypothetical protein Tco_0745106 [Tanacetum coccineum]
MVFNSPCLTDKKELIHHAGTALVYVVPTGKDNFIVSAGRPNMVPAGRIIVSPGSIIFGPGSKDLSRVASILVHHTSYSLRSEKPLLALRPIRTSDSFKSTRRCRRVHLLQPELTLGELGIQLLLPNSNELHGPPLSSSRSRCHR